MKTFSSSSVIAKLKERQRKQDDIEYRFACVLAEKLPQEEMVYAAFVVSANTLLYDMRYGTERVPHDLVGLPDVLVAMLSMGIPALARRCLPPDEAEAACAMIRRIDAMSSA